MSGGDAILVEIFDESAPPDEVDRVTRSLRSELLEIDEVGSVRPVDAGPAPEGTRGIGVEALGALVVSAQPTVELVKKVLDVLWAWVGRSGARHERRTMRVTVNGHTIELDPTAEQQQALVEKFLLDAARPTGA
jgi:hypothetical protein